MKPRCCTTLPALLALLAGSSAHAASASEQRCPNVSIEPDAAFRQRFPELLERIRTDLSARGDIDACARVELRLEPVALIGVSVTLPDGRAASRNVTRGDDVIPTLQALLLVPARAADAPATPAVAPTPAVPARHASSVRRALPSDSARAERDVPAAATAPPRQLGFELSLIGGTRVGDGQYSYGAGAMAFLEVKRWLLGFEGRADGYRALQGSDPETALELAILAGRRLDFGVVALDLVAGPAVAMKGVALSQSESAAVMMSPGQAPAPPPESRNEPSSGPVPRLLFGARVGFSPRAVFRTFVGIDAEWGPARAPTAPGDNIESPRLPNYSIGLALGATVGTP